MALTCFPRLAVGRVNEGGPFFQEVAFASKVESCSPRVKGKSVRARSEDMGTGIPTCPVDQIDQVGIYLSDLKTDIGIYFICYYLLTIVLSTFRSSLSPCRRWVSVSETRHALDVSKTWVSGSLDSQRATRHMRSSTPDP